MKIRFSTEMRCTESGGIDQCYLRAAVGPSIADPDVNGVAFSGLETGYSVRSFQWVKELGAGTHVVRMQAIVQNPATSFDMQAWTLDVETTE